MNLEITIKVDSADNEAMSALVVMFSSLGKSVEIVPKEQPVTVTPTPEPKPVKPAKVKFTEAKPGMTLSEIAGTSAGNPATENLEPPVTEGLSIEAVRALLAEKVNSHRDDIKNKLTELGAPNVTALKAEKYPVFVEYLNSLK